MIETILAGLVLDDEYSRKVAPYLKPDYFDDPAARHFRVVYETVYAYMTRYGSRPTVEALGVELAQRPGVNENVFRDAAKLVGTLREHLDPATDRAWLVDQTEAFCRKRSLHMGVNKYIEVMRGESRDLTEDGLADYVRQAASVSFTTTLGHSYFDDAEKRWEEYVKRESRVPFDLASLNRITRGGLPPKSLSCILASTGVGKSMVMSHLAAANMTMGKNVVYFSLEMSEIGSTSIGERIDANLMGVNMDMIAALQKEQFMRKVADMRAKTLGDLIIKQYPTAGASAHHFRVFLDQLRNKKTFKPDIVYVDYVNLCLSSRIKSGADMNSYMYIKYVAEELRGLAVEYDVPIVTATQTNRSGFNNSDIDLDNVAESWGLPATCDFMIALIPEEELEAKGQLMVKQLKNRWCGTTTNRKFVIGIDKPKSRLRDVEEIASRAVAPGGIASSALAKLNGRLSFGGLK